MTSTSHELKQELQALREKYGQSAVVDTWAAIVGRRLGAPPKRDWPLLHPQLEKNARSLLAGEPWRVPDDRELARQFADEHPQGTSELASVRRRIRRKLHSSRFRYTLYNAFVISM